MCSMVLLLSIYLSSNNVKPLAVGDLDSDIISVETKHKQLPDTLIN